MGLGGSWAQFEFGQWSRGNVTLDAEFACEFLIVSIYDGPDYTGNVAGLYGWSQVYEDHITRWARNYPTVEAMRADLAQIVAPAVKIEGISVSRA